MAAGCPGHIGPRVPSGRATDGQMRADRAGSGAGRSSRAGARNRLGRSSAGSGWAGIPAEARLAGADDRLAAVGDLELVEDVGDVVADRLVADLEPRGDRRGSRGPGRSARAPRPRDRSAPGTASAAGRPRPAAKNAWSRVAIDSPKITSPTATARIARTRSSLSASFGQVAAGAGAHRGEERIVVLGHRQDQDPGPGRACEDLAGRLDPGHPGHPDVHQDDVRRRRLGERDRLAARRRLADELEIRRPVDQRAQPVAVDRVVVDDDDPDRAGGRCSVTARSPGPTRSAPPLGRVAGRASASPRARAIVGRGRRRSAARPDTTVPPLGPCSTRSSPPTSAARSYIALVPTPIASRAIPRPSSVDPDHERPGRAIRDRDRAAARAGVADRVRDRLDDDPVGRDLDRRRQARRSLRRRPRRRSVRARGSRRAAGAARRRGPSASSAGGRSSRESRGSGRSRSRRSRPDLVERARPTRGRVGRRLRPARGRS